MLCAVMTSASLTAQTLKAPLSAKEIKARQKSELAAFKARQKTELDDFIARQKNSSLAGGNLEKAELKDAGDTIAYIYGAFQSGGLKKYIQEQMQVDTTNAQCMEEFYKGIIAETNVDHNNPLVHAYQVGYSIGQKINEMANKLSSDYYSADPDKKISSFVIANSIIAALQGQNEYNPQDAQALFMAQIEERQQANQEKLYGPNRKAGEEFLAENSKKEGVKTTESGLQYKVLKEGNGPIPKRTQKVEVNYEGRLIDGTTFDSSYQRGESVKFGLTQVIPGWTEALSIMPVGSKWEIYLPYDLAYGTQNQGQIKPFSTLIFIVELLGIE